MRRTLSLSIDKLPPSYRDLLANVLPVVQAKTLVTWTLTDMHEADVVCLTLDDHALARTLKSHQLRLWFAAREFSERIATEWDLSLDPSEIRVFGVLAVLDMAALRFIDTVNYPQFGNVTTVVAAPTVTSMHSPGSGPTLYKLKYWVTLPKQFATRKHYNAAAVMTRRSISANDLEKVSALSSEQVMDFIVYLRRTGGLSETRWIPAARPATVASVAATTAAAASPRRNLMGKLRDWLSRAA